MRNLAARVLLPLLLSQVCQDCLMPFKSEKQRRYLYANEPEVAQRWSDKYGDKPVKKLKAESYPTS